MAVTGNYRAVTTRRLFPLAACAALLLPGLIGTTAGEAAAAAPAPRAAAGPNTPLSCKATLLQMVNDALFSGTAGEAKLVTLAAPPGRRLLPATGGATPQAALIGQFEAKSAEGQCAFETTAYVVVPFAILLGFLNMLPKAKAKAALKKLESLSPAQKKAVDNFFVTGKAPKGTNPLALLGGAHNTSPLQGTGPLVRPGYQKLTVKLTKLTPTGATMTVAGQEAGTETLGGHTRTIPVPFTETGIEASKIDGRWFLSGSQGMNFSA